MMVGRHLKQLRGPLEGGSALKKRVRRLFKTRGQKVLKMKGGS